jgi:hypothetical protein
MRRAHACASESVVCAMQAACVRACSACGMTRLGGHGGERLRCGALARRPLLRTCLRAPFHARSRYHLAARGARYGAHRGRRAQRVRRARGGAEQRCSESVVSVRAACAAAATAARSSAAARGRREQAETRALRRRQPRGCVAAPPARRSCLILRRAYLLVARGCVVRRPLLTRGPALRAPRAPGAPQFWTYSRHAAQHAAAARVARATHAHVQLSPALTSAAKRRPHGRFTLPLPCSPATYGLPTYGLPTYTAPSQYGPGTDQAHAAAAAMPLPARLRCMKKRTA